jgi:hypothetical protein
MRAITVSRTHRQACCCHPGRIYRAELREQVPPIMDVLTDLDSYCEANNLHREAWTGKSLIRLMIELAGCEARGDDPSSDLQLRLTRFTERFKKYEEEDQE